MAAEYLSMKTEMSELRKYKTELTNKIKQNQELENLSTPTHEDNIQFTQLNSEKVNQTGKKKMEYNFFTIWEGGPTPILFLYNHIKLIYRVQKIMHKTFCVVAKILKGVP